MSGTKRVEIEETADGSMTLYRKDIDEHYHSVKGALAESKHVYLSLGWEAAAQRRDDVRVLEVGFGTGLNAALTAVQSRKRRVKTEYYGAELFPLAKETTDILARQQEEDLREDFVRVNEAEWNKIVSVDDYFSLCKIEGDILKIELPQDIDVVYFDAFAPEKQPELWDVALFEKLFASMRTGGVLVTYCAKGVVRRMLQQVGFKAERLPGPPAGKREVLRVTKP